MNANMSNRRAQIVELMQRHGIGYFDYEGPEGRLTVQADRPDEHPPILAAMSGIFLLRHPAGKDEPVWPRRVKAGAVIGWLKIGPVLEPVFATEDAVLRRPQLADGVLANYGDRLF